MSSFEIYIVIFYELFKKHEMGVCFLDKVLLLGVRFGLDLVGQKRVSQVFFHGQAIYIGRVLVKRTLTSTGGTNIRSTDGVLWYGYRDSDCNIWSSTVWRFYSPPGKRYSTGALSNSFKRSILLYYIYQSSIHRY